MKHIQHYHTATIKPFIYSLVLVLLLVVGPYLRAFAVQSTDTGVRPQKSDAGGNTFQTLRSDEGFLFSQLDTSWFRSPTPEDKQDIHILFRAPTVNDGFQPIMTVRVDNRIGNTKSIDEYVQQWMGDYSKLGYEVLGSRPFRHKNEVGYVIDVRNQSSNNNVKNPKPSKQIRQAVFFRRREKAVILTCIDNASSFKNTLKECNKIIRAFTWASQNTKKTKSDLTENVPTATSM